MFDSYETKKVGATKTEILGKQLVCLMSFLSHELVVSFFLSFKSGVLTQDHIRNEIFCLGTSIDMVLSQDSRAVIHAMIGSDCISKYAVLGLRFGEIVLVLKLINIQF